MFIIYVAEDGTLFDNAKDCHNRELALAMAEGIKNHTLILFNNVINKSFSATDLLYEKDVIAVINKYTDYFYCEDTELFQKMIDAGAEKINGLFPSHLYRWNHAKEHWENVTDEMKKCQYQLKCSEMRLQELKEEIDNVFDGITEM